MEDTSRNNQVLTVLYSKSPLAIDLEKNLNISFDLEQNDPFDNCLYLRACIPEKLLITNSPNVICTGIEFKLSHPRFVFEVSNYSNLIYEKGIGVLNNKFDYNFPNTLKLLLYNYSEVEQHIYPGEIIATVKFVYNALFEIRRDTENQISLDSRKSKDNNWVSEIIRKENKLLNDIQSFDYRTSTNYNPTIINSMIANRQK